MAGVIGCAVEGLGVAVASLWSCARELSSGALVELLADHALDPVSSYIISPAGRKASQKARAFSDHLAAALSP